MTTHAIDRIVADARIGPHDSPHEAAAHVWTQVVARHDVPSAGALGRMGVLERVVLVLGDVIGLSPGTIAEVLNTDEATIRATRAAACERIGLPSVAEHSCDGWDAERAQLPPGDPEVIDALLDHTAGCERCTRVLRSDRVRLRRRLAQRALGTARHRPVVAAAVGSIGTTATAAAVIGVGLAVGAAVAPMPSPPTLVPVVVDASPELPSDEQPPAGWPTSQPGPTSDDGRADEPATTTEQPAGPAEDPGGDRHTPDEQAPEPGPSDDDLTDTVEETVDDTDDTVRDTVEDLDDAVGDLDDAVEDLDDAVEDVTDGLRETTEDVTEGLSDTTDGFTDDGAGLLVP